MRVVVTKTFIFDTDTIKDMMLSAGYEEEDFEDKDEIENFFFGLNAWDLEDNADYDDTDVDTDMTKEE